MNIYISGLDVKVTDQALTTLFSNYGHVSSSRVMIDGFTGYSRGFAFVEMPDDAEAVAAIAATNGLLVDGRTIIVREANVPVQHKGSYPVGGKSRR